MAGEWSGTARRDRGALRARRASILCVASSGALLAGCAADRVDPLLARIDAQIAPLVRMDPDANWTACYNGLLRIGAASVERVAGHPRLREPVAPDDLRAALLLSLWRQLVLPAGAPALSVNCFETTFDLLHLDPKVGGRRLGALCIPPEAPVGGLYDLYPLDFSHALAARIDIEGDRRAMRAWLQNLRSRAETPPLRPALRPRVADLLRVLARRQADRWSREPAEVTWLCHSGPLWQAAATRDYNLVRAACVWLGGREDEVVQARLIELVGSESAIVSHNALFALRYSPDQRIRKAIEGFQRSRPLRPPVIWST